MGLLISFLLDFFSLSKTTLNPKARSPRFLLSWSYYIQIKVLRNHPSHSSPSDIIILRWGDLTISGYSETDLSESWASAWVQLIWTTRFSQFNRWLRATVNSLTRNHEDGHIKQHMIYSFSFWNWGKNMQKRNKQLFFFF